MRSTPSGSTDQGLDARDGRGDLPASEIQPSDWLRIDVSLAALESNLALFRQRAKPPSRLLAVVKANGYGHGLLLAARAFLAGGADMLGVHALAEARSLRAGGVNAPVLVLGPVTSDEAVEAAQLGAEITVGSLTGCRAIAAAGQRGARCRVHLKVETGVWRQGILAEELDAALAELEQAPRAELVGLASHFADIEDTTDHSFARRQDELFEEIGRKLIARGHRNLCRHMSCSAAAILWKSSYRDLVRVGISGYGIWPSRETRISAREAGQGDLALQPALTWSCRIAQVKRLPAGQTVGYGRTWKAPVPSKLALLPVGYADGYPRALSNRAHVLIRGEQAPLRGRICMNMCMVDVTHIPEAAADDEAVLLGRQGLEEISAEQLAEFIHTIPYEIITLPGPTWRRVGI